MSFAAPVRMRKPRLNPLSSVPRNKRRKPNWTPAAREHFALKTWSLQYAALKAKAARTLTMKRNSKKLAGEPCSRESAKCELLHHTVCRELERKPAGNPSERFSRRGLPAELSRKTRCRNWGPRVSGIRILLGEDHVYAIVVTATTRKKSN